MKFRSNMARLNILDQGLNPVGTINQFSSLTIKEDFYGVGTWEAETVLSEKVLRLIEPFLSSPEIAPTRFVEFNTENGVAGIMDRAVLSVDEKSSSIRMGGKVLDGLCNWRRVVPDDNPDNQGWDVSQGKTGAIMAHYVDGHMVNPSYPDRKIPNLEIAYDSYGVGAESVAKGRFDPVSDVIEDLGRDMRVGWHIRLQREVVDALTGQYRYGMIFTALEPVDRTNGSDRPVILTAGNRNISKATLTIDLSSHYNTVYALGEGEYDERFYRAFSSSDTLPTGLSRREFVVDCGNEDDLEHLKSTAMQKISDMLKTDTLEISSVPEDLAAGLSDGDIVTVNIPEFQIRVDMLIVQAQAKISRGSIGYNLTLGNPPETMTRMIDRYERLKTIK